MSKSKRRLGKKKAMILGGLFLLIIMVKSVATLITNAAGREFREEASQVYLDSILAREEDTQVPNVILILTDDLGMGDLSCYDSTLIQTPNIDRLADEGVKMTEYYAPSPVCTPSRAGLLTGRYPVRTHMPSVVFPTGSMTDRIMKLSGGSSYGVTGIPKDEILIPEALKARGYKTAMLGKWHLGDQEGHLPNDNGFDEFYGALYSNDMKPYAVYRNDEIELEAPVDQSQLTKRFTEEAVSFISENKNEPFFLYYAQPFPHVPLYASDEYTNVSEAGLYGDVIEEVDWSVGEILEALQKEGVDDNTIIIFTSDNGPWHEGSAGGSRGRKGNNYEGGQKVPFLVRWPEGLPEGLVVDSMSMGIDVFPTIMKLAGVPLPEDRVIDGKDIMPLLRGETESSPHDVLYYIKGKEVAAVRNDRWKYHGRNSSENATYWMVKVGPWLFDLNEDPNESYSHLEHEPEMADALKARLEAMQKEFDENLRGWR